MRILLCPVFLVRFAPLLGCEGGQAPRYRGSEFQKFFEMEQATDRLRSDVHRELSKILERSDQRINPELIKLRRDVYNKRWSRILNHANGCIDKEILSNVQSLQTLSNSIIAYNKELALFGATLNAHITATIEAFRKALINNTVILAFPLSSPSFLLRIETCLSIPLTSNGLSQNAISVIKYFTRCATKTSPFSYFGPCGYGQFSTSPATWQLPETWSLESFPAINLDSLGPILSELNTRTANFCPTFNYNKSFCKIGAIYYWILQRGRVDRVRSCREPTDVNIKNFLDHISSGVESEAALTHEFHGLSPTTKDQLVAAGIFIPEENWYKSALLNPGQPIKYPAKPAETIAHELAIKLDSPLKDFRSGDVVKRQNALRQITDSLKACTALLESTRPCKSASVLSSAEPDGTGPNLAMKEPSPIREDVALLGVVGLNPEIVEPHLEPLSRLHQIFFPFSVHGQSLELLTRLFEKWYPVETEVNLLVFLRQLLGFLSHNTKSQSDRLCLFEELTSSGGKCGEGEAWCAKRQELVRCITTFLSLSPSGNTIDLTPLLANISPFATPHSGLTGALLQDCMSQEGFDWVVNDLGPGSGRAIRRWFEYKPDFHRVFNNWLKECSDEALDVVIVDDVLVNTDRGPHVFDSHFDVPGLRYFDPTSTKVSVGDCFVSLGTDRSMRLTHAPTRRRIYTHYDSVLTLKLRPLLTQFLTLFSRPGTGLDVRLLASFVRGNLTKQPSQQPGKPSTHPRLTLGSKIVIARRAWRLENCDLPAVAGNTLPPEIIHIYRRWRAEVGLPDAVYIRAIGVNNGSENRRVGDHRKPQYIAFTDPLWILLFHRCVTQIAGPIWIEEALPTPTLDAPSANRIRETAIHWSYRNG